LPRAALLSTTKLPCGRKRKNPKIAAAESEPKTPASTPNRIETVTTTARNASGIMPTLAAIP
jgi:hypothetical protein